jgi:hypothetical protein
MYKRNINHLLAQVWAFSRCWSVVAAQQLCIHLSPAVCLSLCFLQALHRMESCLNNWFICAVQADSVRLLGASKAHRKVFKPLLFDITQCHGWLTYLMLICAVQADSVRLPGSSEAHRFCFQCGKLEPRSLFELDNR